MSGGNLPPALITHASAPPPPVTPRNEVWLGNSVPEVLIRSDQGEVVLAIRTQVVTITIALRGGAVVQAEIPSSALAAILAAGGK